MPTRIELSIANHTGILQILHPVIERFEQARRSSVQLTVMEWDTIWKDLVNIGIYKRGADVSEVGTTWMGSLISMNSLRAFTRAEIDQIGGERAFLPICLANHFFSWRRARAGDPVPVGRARDLLLAGHAGKSRGGRSHGFLLLRGDGGNTQPAERGCLHSMGIFNGYIHS